MNLPLSLSNLRRHALSVLLLIVALLIGWHLWQYYENSPWTRDGRVKANIVQVAPDVSGQLIKLYVHDNEEVEPGQPLFDIDRARFELALRQALAAEQSANIAQQQAQREARRNDELRDLVPEEVREQGRARLEQARAALTQAIVNRDTAKLNLNRTQVVAEARGIVTNLDVQVGAYVTASRPVLALVDRDSYYVEGYFEETKLANIRSGDPAKVTLMGEQRSLNGHVDSLARGIVDRERSTGNNLLQNINPAFNWVRLVQRIPVKIVLDPLPAGVRLIAGQTATIEVNETH